MVAQEVEKIYLTTLKDTVRGVDYRKATILLSNAFEKVCTNSEFFCLFNTTVRSCILQKLVGVRKPF